MTNVKDFIWDELDNYGINGSVEVERDPDFMEDRYIVKTHVDDNTYEFKLAFTDEEIKYLPESVIKVQVKSCVINMYDTILENEIYN